MIYIFLTTLPCKKTVKKSTRLYASVRFNEIHCIFIIRINTYEYFLNKEILQKEKPFFT